MVTIKEFSTRVQGMPYTFRLVLDDNGLTRLKVDDHKGPVSLEVIGKADVLGEHLRAHAAEFLTGSTI